MATFHGTLRLAAEPDAVHSATVILVDDRFVLRAAGAEVGDWQLRDLSFDYAGEDIRVRIDDDEALLSMPERGAFAAAVGLSETAASVAQPDPTPPEPEPQSEGAASVAQPDPTPPEPELQSEGAASVAQPDPTPPEPESQSQATGNSGPEPGEPAGTLETSDPENLAKPESTGVGGAATATTPAAEEPEPGFAVGVGGNPSATAEPLEASAEPGFSVGVAPGDEPPAATASDPLTPPPAPWDQLTPEALETTPGIPHAAGADVGADSQAVPEPTTPEPHIDADPQASTPADVITTPDDVAPPEDFAPGGDEPTETPETNDLPVEAAAAAAAVWGVRNPPESTAPPQPDEPTTVAEGSDLGQEDLVAARLAAQRQSPLTASEPAAPTDVSAASPEADLAIDTEAESPAISEPDGDDGTEEGSDDGLNRLRTQSAAGYLDDETLRKWVAWGLLIGGVVIGIGAFLTWGDTRMFDNTDFPVARALAGVSALAAVAGFVLGFFMHRRTEGAYVAGTGAALGLMTLFIYGRAAGIGTGFFIALLGVVVVAGLAVLAITPAGGSKEKRTGR